MHRRLLQGKVCKDGFQYVLEHRSWNRTSGSGASPIPAATALVAPFIEPLAQHDAQRNLDLAVRARKLKGVEVPNRDEVVAGEILGGLRSPTSGQAVPFTWMLSSPFC
jgi:hypothetical protein